MKIQYQINLKENPKISCVVGLIAEPKDLHDVRKNRISTIKETEKTDYTKVENIRK